MKGRSGGDLASEATLGWVEVWMQMNATLRDSVLEGIKERDLALEECGVWSWECYLLLFTMSDARTCLNTSSLDP